MVLTTAVGFSLFSRNNIVDTLFHIYTDVVTGLVLDNAHIHTYNILGCVPMRYKSSFLAVGDLFFE